jgi:CheY-like chemotaxis protein
MEQVLLNLAVNGRDAMPRGGRLLIEVVRVEHRGEGGPGPALQPGRYALLQVADDGVGIAPDVLPHIFEPFFTTKGVGAGTGLGLATVYGIVRQSGGHIEVESEPERGATFRVYLPLVTREASPGSDRDEAQDGTGTGSILLVEDDTTVRRLTRTLLEKAGYQVTEAGNGREALAILGCPDARFDGVLTDLVMPEMGGVELAETLRESWPDLPVLFMTGYTEDQVILHGLQDPRSGVLHKPFTADALLHKLAGILGR